MQNLAWKFAVFVSTMFFYAVCTELGNETLSYAGYKAHVIQPHSTAHLKALKKLSKVQGIDFWSPPNKYKPVTAMVAPEALTKFNKLLKKKAVPFDVTISDVSLKIEEERNVQKQLMQIKGDGKTYLKRYLRYDEIVATMKNLTETYPNKASLEIIGKSFEGRDVYMIKLSGGGGDNRPVVLIGAGIHAREWAAPALALHIMHEVLEHPKLLKTMDWYIIPSQNPDGYEYTHTKDRLWRKTRSQLLQNGGCHGADANRNFAVHWGEVGSSKDPCEEIYHGASAFSEVESRNTASVGNKYKDRIKVYMDLHSFGNYILYPYGHTKTLVRDWKISDKCGRQAADAIVKSGGPRFTVGNTATVLYPSGGGSDDYMKYKFKINRAYTVELPGGGMSGFDLPPSKIDSMVHQVFPGIEKLAHCW